MISYNLLSAWEFNTFLFYFNMYYIFHIFLEIYFNSGVRPYKNIFWFNIMITDCGYLAAVLLMFLTNTI